MHSCQHQRTRWPVPQTNAEQTSAPPLWPPRLPRGPPLTARSAMGSTALSWNFFAKVYLILFTVIHLIFKIDACVRSETHPLTLLQSSMQGPLPPAPLTEGQPQSPLRGDGDMSRLQLPTPAGGVWRNGHLQQLAAGFQVKLLSSVLHLREVRVTVFFPKGKQCGAACGRNTVRGGPPGRVFGAGNWLAEQTHSR